jgi:two-component system sensor histidine kinase/response regulator
MEKYKGCKILIVDDLPTNLQVLAGILHNTGFQIFMATSGKQAIAIADAKQPDLILLDINMPEMDGYETCGILKENSKTKAIPIIFLTALTDTQDIIKGFELGAVDYVTKPFKSAELLARINTHLELMETNQKLAQSEKQLSKTNASKDKFFSIIAHDLRGPFQGSLGLTELVMMDNTFFNQEDLLDLIKKIHKSQRNLLNLIENLLDWSRVQTGSLEYKPEIIKCNDLIEEIIKLFVDISSQKNIQISFDKSANAEIFADYFMIQTTIRNLISNALKFTPMGGNITISCTQEQNICIIKISDNGIGISKDDLRKIFRIDVNHTTIGTNKEKGTGLGLILCKEFVETNHGTIEVESELNKGTSFTLTLPSSENI